MDNSEFKYYPDKEDPQFYEKIYRKLEFYKHQYEDEKRSMEEICDRGEFVLAPQQEYLKNYISPQTPYNGVLIMHETGTGKTCTAIQIAEGFKETLKSYNKRILVISSEAIKKNFKKELYNFSKEKLKKKREDSVQCTGLTYELGKDMDYLTIEQRKARVEQMIKAHYKFYAPMAFSNYVMKKLLNWDGNLETLDEKQKKKIKQKFSKTIIIFDEVHNIRRGIKIVGVKKILKILEAIIKFSNNLRIVLMSATPMYDRPREIIDLLNLLLLNDNKQPIVESEVFDKKGNLTAKGEEIIYEASKGYISYLRGENPSSFPVRLVPKEAVIPDVKYNIFGERLEKDEKIRFTEIVECPMEGIQLETYKEYMQDSTKSHKRPIF